MDVIAKWKILVTGGTGFIGSHLVEALLKEGHGVRCLVRRTSNLNFLNKLNVEKVYGDVKDTSSLEYAVEGVDVIYHIAGILGRWRIPKETYWRVHVEGTKNLLDAIIRRDISLERFVYCSSAGVLGPIKKLPADESYPYRPSNIYEESKAEAEKMVLHYYTTTSLPVTVIRPELVYGPRDTHVLGLFKAIKNGRFFLIDGGKSVLHPTYISDLVEGFKLCTHKSKAIGQVYLITGGEYVTVRELASTIAGIMGVPSKFFSLPKSFASKTALLSEKLASSFNFDPLLTQSMVNFFTENRGFDTSKARNELGYYPRVTLEEGIKETVQWYVAKGLL